MTRLRVQRGCGWRASEVRWMGRRVQWVISPVQVALFTFPPGLGYAPATHIWSVSPLKRG